MTPNAVGLGFVVGCMFADEDDSDRDTTVRTVALSETDIIMCDSAEVDFYVGVPLNKPPAALVFDFDVGEPCSCVLCISRYHMVTAGLFRPVVFNHAFD